MATMAQRLMFGVMYRVGFTPWEGHPLPAALTATAGRLPKGRALDVGCGTGETSIVLAKSGWKVTGVDFVERAIDRARARAAAARVDVQFVRGDVTRLRDIGVQGPFQLIADNGCLHSMSDEGRDALVRELADVASPGATLVIAAFPVAKRRGPRGIDQSEIDRRFGTNWQVGRGAVESGLSHDPADPIVVYELRRHETAPAQPVTCA
jgi:SAM-dependent methyltransferase